MARIVNLAHDDIDVNLVEKDRSKPRAYLKLIDANSEEVINILGLLRLNYFQGAHFTNDFVL